MDNFSLLESLVRSLYRKYYPNKEKYTLELIIVNTLGKIIKADPEKQKVFWGDLYQKLLKIKSKATHSEDLILNYAYVFQWVKSKVQDKTLVQVLVEEPYTYTIH